MRLSRQRLSAISGLLAVGIYLAMAVASWAWYPGPFGPSGNWLSDLGNNDLNPAGAVFYRLGGILSGLGLAAHFLALDGRAWAKRRAVHVLCNLVRVLGTIASASFILTGVYSEDMMPMHSWFSIANYAAFGTAIALTGVARLCGAALPDWLATICFAAWGIDIVSAAFGDTRWLEWVVVAFLIAYVTGSCLSSASAPTCSDPAARAPDCYQQDQGVVSVRRGVKR